MTAEEQKEREKLMKDLVGTDSNKSYEAHLKLKAMKAREESQKRLDPQWIPSDAEMINWVDRAGFQVYPGQYNEDRVRLWAVIVPSLNYVIAHGETWRAAVEVAMRKEKEYV